MIILLTAVLLYWRSNQIKLINFKNMNISEATKYSSKNKLKLEIIKDYSLEVEEHHIIKQNIKPNTTISKGSKIVLYVSDGPDPQEKIKLIDFKNTELSKVQSFIDENKLYGVDLTLEYSNDIPKNKLITQKYNDELINDNNYKRSDSLKLVYSKGVKPIIKDISVLDFTNKNKQEVMEWVNSKQVKVVYIEQFSDDVMAGVVLSQSIKTKEKISTVDEITFTISKGKGIIIPNYQNYTINNYMNANSDVRVDAKTSFSNLPYGTLISQSVAAGSVLKQGDAQVSVTYSEGLPYVDNLIGRNAKEVESYFSTLNDKNANVKYMVYYEKANTPEEVGLVIRASKNNSYVDFNSEMYIVIGK